MTCCNTQTAAAPAINAGSWVKYNNEKRWLIGYSPKGKAVLLVPAVSGQPSRPDQYVSPANISAWVDAAPVVETAVDRFFNVYTEGRVGHLVKTLADANENSLSSDRARVGVVKLHISQTNDTFAVAAEFTAV